MYNSSIHLKMSNYPYRLRDIYIAITQRCNYHDSCRCKWVKTITSQKEYKSFYVYCCTKLNVAGQLAGVTF